MLVGRALERMLGAFAERAVWVSVHSGDPGEFGLGEIVSAGRQTLAWTRPDGGQVASAARLMWVVPRRTTVTHLGYWESKQGGLFLGSRVLEQPAGFKETGSLTIWPGDLVEGLVS